MKIKSVRIKNFRSVSDETVNFNDYTCLVGPNGAGKSTVLCALNVFFRETGHSATDLLNLHEEDFHKRLVANPVEITVTFEGLSPEAQADFADYFRQGELVITASATYDPNSQRAEVRQYGQRMAMTAFAPFFEAAGDGKLVTELRNTYSQLKVDYPDLPTANTKQAMIDALHAYEGEHPDLCKLIPSGDQFYGVSKGANRLEKYIQWVFIPAVKDPSSEDGGAKNSALSKLLARTVNTRANLVERIKDFHKRAEDEYRNILGEHQVDLDALSTSLQERLASWSHPDTSLKLTWTDEPGKSVRVDEPFAQIVAGEGAFAGRLARFGHGLQRSYLVALLHELSGCGEGAGPRLLLGFEEPELYQHPPQAQHLAELLQELSRQNSQVVVCTHSPYFVSGEFFEDVRLVRKHKIDHCSLVTQVTYDDLAKKLAGASGEPPTKPNGITAQIHQALQPSLNEMFFSPVLVLVEGLEDVAYLTTCLHLAGLWSDWRSLRCHLVRTDGKSRIIQPLAIAELMCIPTFVVFDADAQEPDKNGSRTKHEKDNSVLLALAGVTDPDPMPTQTYWGDRVVMWKSNMGDVVADDIGQADWVQAKDEARRRNGQVANLDKNSLFIADALEIAWSAGRRPASLVRLCEAIIAFART